MSPSPLALDPERLADALRRAQAAGRIARVEVEAEPGDALAWLATRPSSWRMFWHGRAEQVDVASAGAALAIDAPSLAVLSARLAPVLSALPPGARLFGAARFDPDTPAVPAWEAFGIVRFVLPRVELVSRGSTNRLWIHALPHESPDIVLREVEELLAPPVAVFGSLPPLTARFDTPEEWTGLVAIALGEIAAGQLDKVVLARQSMLDFAEPLDPFALLARLRAGAPDPFPSGNLRFHVALAAGDAVFLSATPERLFRLDGRDLQTEAVAGTRAEHANGLSESEKDRREHNFVVDDIVAGLRPYTEHDPLIESVPSVLRAGNGLQHLHTGIRARLREGVGAADVLAALHPTPAVCGTPRVAALDAIRALEGFPEFLASGFDRGLYAGPIGWIGRNADGEEAAEFAVGIRSALVTGARAWLYAGAGIVAGSEPEAEAAEVEHKLGGFLRLWEGEKR